jgi:CDGSH-type Zn-finger protein
MKSMAPADSEQTQDDKKISIIKNGPYIIKGSVPFVLKEQVVSEFGEPLAWRKVESYETVEEIHLCRCGESCNKPYCDGTHRKIGFDGTESAVTSTSETRQFNINGGTHLIVKKDPMLCMESGFCGMHDKKIGQLISETDDTKIRALVINMVERCPAGALTYHIEEGEPDIEPDLPRQIADTTEITSDGPIAGPLWVTGNIPVERSDGQPFETRNRVTLCNCGHSDSKPLCDGTHRHEAKHLGRMR